MYKREIWAIDHERFNTYFRSLSGSVACAEGFRIADCMIRIASLPQKIVGRLAFPQTEVIFEGPDGQCAQVYDRFFKRFVSAGG